MKSQTDLLSRTIESLPLSSEFKTFAADMQYNTLDDLLQLKVYQLIEKPGFNYHMLHEFAQFLKSENLIGELKGN